MWLNPLLASSISTLPSLLVNVYSSWIRQQLRQKRKGAQVRPFSRKHFHHSPSMNAQHVYNIGFQVRPFSRKHFHHSPSMNAQHVYNVGLCRCTIKYSIAFVIHIVFKWHQLCAALVMHGFCHAESKSPGTTNIFLDIGNRPCQSRAGFDTQRVSQSWRIDHEVLLT